MRFVANLRVRTKILVSFALAGAMCAVALFVGWSSVSSVSHDVQDHYSAALVAQTGSAAAYNMHVSQIQYVADGGKVLEMHRGDKAAFEQALQRLEGLAATPAERSELARVRATYAAWTKLDDRIFALADAGRRQEAVGLIDGPANAASDRLSAALASYAGTVRKRADSSASSATGSAHAKMALFAVLALLVAVAMTFLLSRVVSGAVSRIAAFAGSVAHGDLRKRLNAGTSDEFGRLSDSLDEMVENLAALSGEILENATAVGSSASEILATVNQQTAGANEQSAAINETTTATEEIRASAEQAAHAAQEVSTQAEEAARVSGEGTEAVEAIVTGMAEIREKVDAIAQDVQALSDQTGQIEEITHAVNDLADQSNLLALNATIEAARAGEQGKGFAVVADEVRNLAEQSKQATAQVQTILQDIQRATRAAVAAAEEGTTVVEHGSGLAEHAGELIAQLSTASHAVGQAAQQISASAQQQNAGMDQVAQGMRETSQAAAEFVAGVHQSQAAAEGLNQVAAELQRLAGQYKV